MADAENPPVPTELVAGKYRLTRLVGRGGMGSVWEGVHDTLGTRVAIKFIEREYVDSPEARSRFENEARAAAKLGSKHVVRVFDHGLMGDGRPYIVMEFLEGEPLDQRLDRLGRLGAQDTARIVLQVCRGLANAHSAGIVHRDLKPENVFLVWDAEDQSDVVKIVDFGVAKFVDSASGMSSATRTGSVLGTPFFMSPEQARGLRGVDHRSDLWSVGVITYRCLVGQLPFEGEAVGDLLVKICTAPLPVPSALAPDVPPGFDAWFTRALAREPNERFSNAAELAQALMATCGLTPPASSLGGPVSPVVTSTAGTAIPASLRTTERAVPGMTASGVTTQSAGTAVQRKPAALIAMVLGVMVLLLIGIIAVVKFSRSGGAAESAPPSSEPGANTQPALATPAAAPAATSAGPLSTQSAQAPSVQPVQAAAPSASAEMAAPKRAALTPKPQATAESSLSSPQKPRVKPKSGQAKSKEAIDVGY